jgi:hypothetical protein
MVGQAAVPTVIRLEEVQHRQRQALRLTEPTSLPTDLQVDYLLTAAKVVVAAVAARHKSELLELVQVALGQAVA